MTLPDFTAAKDFPPAGMLNLLADSLEAGLCLLLELRERGESEDVLIHTLRGFAQEAAGIFTSTSCEPPGVLFEAAAAARRASTPERFAHLASELRAFLARPQLAHSS